MTALWVAIAGAGAYLILVGSLDADELAAAVIVGVLAAGWHAAMLRVDARRFAFDRKAAGALARAVAGLPGGTARVGTRLVAALRRGAGGRQIEQRFDAGAWGRPDEAGRRAVVVLATSFAPDSYVLRVPPEEPVILFHALTDHAPGRDPRWPS